GGAGGGAGGGEGGGGGAVPCGDHPNPDACADAGCEWDGVRCSPPLPDCDALAEVACMARQDCIWRGDACEVDPAGMECEDFDADACMMQMRCLWVGDGCQDHQRGACDAIEDEAVCDARPDCAPYFDSACVIVGEYAGCENDVAFAGCGREIVDCGAVPVEACERTPGCQVELVDTPCAPDQGECEPVPVCVPEEVDPCDGLDERACGAVEGCRGRWEFNEDECFDEDGFGEGRDCQVFICERDPNAAVCEDLDRDQCVGRGDCLWTQVGGGGDCACPPPPPCDCAPNDPACQCIAPEPCECEDPDADPAQFACIPRNGGGACEDLTPDQCRGAANCELLEACADCPPCPPGVECEPCEGGCFFECVPVIQPDVCEQFEPDECLDVDGCELVEECDDCACPPGERDCDCAGVCQVRCVTGGGGGGRCADVPARLRGGRPPSARPVPRHPGPRPVPGHPRLRCPRGVPRLLLRGRPR
ncbi:MAG: hypothetical protein ACYTF3_13385, partial [Planctomycetota bacterium]